MKNVSIAKYLGVMLSTGAKTEKDVLKRFAKVTKAFNHIHPYWRGAGGRKWKDKMLISIIVPMTTYAADDQDLKKMDATYRKLLRRALRVPSSYHTEIFDPEKAKVKTV